VERPHERGCHGQARAGGGSRSARAANTYNSNLVYRVLSGDHAPHAAPTPRSTCNSSWSSTRTRSRGSPHGTQLQLVVAIVDHGLKEESRCHGGRRRIRAVPTSTSMCNSSCSSMRTRSLGPPPNATTACCTA
jgi:hypothetical protein